MEKDLLLNVSIIEPIRCGMADVLYAEKDCVMILDRPSNVVMLQTENIELADKLLGKLPKGVTHIVAHNLSLAKLVERKLGYKRRIPCYQAVYNKEPFLIENNGLEIRLMQKEDVEEACAMYFDSEDEAREHIAYRNLYCGVYKGKIAAMIGLHLEGSMGLLVVKEEYRRMGFGETMEKFLINSLLKRGMTPYCQIIEGNSASLGLQRKIGFDISENMLYWMLKE